MFAFRSLLLAPWWRGPLMLIRQPSVAFALVIAASVAALPVAAAPLFLSSAANATLHSRIDSTCPADLGLQTSATDLGSPEFIHATASAADREANAVACQDVTREYQVDRHSFAALTDIDLAVPAGRFAAVIGPSGAGKSTLLRLLAAIDAPDRGTITVMGRDVGALPERKRARFRRVQLGFVRQTPADNLLEYLTVRQHLRLGAQMRGRRGVHDGELLPALGMADRANRLPRQLSGGEQQRLAIAFAAAGSPAVLIADEPTGQLDHAHVDDVVDAFRTIASTGIAVIAATHDPAVWERADLVIRLRGGRIDREHA